MEASKWPQRLSKQGYDLDWTQSYRVRCTDPESYLAHEDTLEERVRHTHSKQATRSEPRERTQPRSMGEYSRLSQD